MLVNCVMDKEPIIRRIWRNNRKASTLLISVPNEIALKHGVKFGSNLLLIDKPDGIFFKKLEVKDWLENNTEVSNLMNEYSKLLKIVKLHVKQCTDFQRQVLEEFKEQE